ncbi:Holliday junction resolvase [Candidatus Woesearchaeota archaeon]|nr:Holliday junction resolvase [Candidatus Woesearchaeota archaeon]
MSSKGKGSRLERELIQKFYNTGVFIPLRAAGSGSTPLPSPDLLVGGKGRVLAIECKGGKGARYIDKKQISELKEFAEKFGAEPWVGSRFNNTEWLFLKIENLKESKTGNNFVINVEYAKEKGIRFEELIK